MTLSLEKKTKMLILRDKASKLLIEKEQNPKEQIATEKDNEFHEIITRIYSNNPLLAEKYRKQYNMIQEVKYKKEGATYLKRLRKNDLGKIK